MALIIDFKTRKTSFSPPAYDPRDVAFRYDYLMQRVDHDGHVEARVHGIGPISDIKAMAQADYDALSDLVGEPRVELVWSQNLIGNMLFAEHDGYRYEILIHKERGHAS